MSVCSPVQVQFRQTEPVLVLLFRCLSQWEQLSGSLSPLSVSNSVSLVVSLVLWGILLFFLSCHFAAWQPAAGFINKNSSSAFSLDSAGPEPTQDQQTGGQRSRDPDPDTTHVIFTEATAQSEYITISNQCELFKVCTAHRPNKSVRDVWED